MTIDEFIKKLKQFPENAQVEIKILIPEELGDADESWSEDVSFRLSDDGAKLYIDPN